MKNRRKDDSITWAVVIWRSLKPRLYELFLSCQVNIDTGGFGEGIFLR